MGGRKDKRQKEPTPPPPSRRSQRQMEIDSKLAHDLDAEERGLRPRAQPSLVIRDPEAPPRDTGAGSSHAPETSQPRKRSKSVRPPPQPVTELTVQVPYGIKFVNQEAVDKYKEFVALEKQFMSSRFIDIPTLQTLGIYDTVRDMVSQLGLWEFLTHPVKSYYSLCLEFFCTAKFQYSDPPSMQFYMRGRRYLLTAEQLSNIVGFPYFFGVENDDVYFPPDYTYEHFIEVVTGAPYNKLNKKSSLIQHPAIRYVQKILSFTLLPRGEASGTLYQREMFFLYCMLDRNDDGTPKETPNCALDVIRHLGTTCKSLSRNSRIPMGGLLTRIFLHYHPNGYLDPKDVIPGPTVLDLQGLMRMDVLVKQPAAQFGEPFQTKLHSNNIYDLPLPQPLDFFDQQTWRIEGPVPPPVAPAQPQPAQQEQQQAQPQMQQAGVATLDSLMAYLTLMNNNNNQRFDNIDNRLETFQTSVTSRIEALETVYDTRLDSIEESMGEFQTSMTGYENQIREYNRRMDTWQTQQRIDSRYLADIYRYGEHRDYFTGEASTAPPDAFEVDNGAGNNTGNGQGDGGNNPEAAD